MITGACPGQILMSLKLLHLYLRGSNGDSLSLQDFRFFRSENVKVGPLWFINIHSVFKISKNSKTSDLELASFLETLWGHFGDNKIFRKKPHSNRIILTHQLNRRSLYAKFHTTKQNQSGKWVSQNWETTLEVTWIKKPCKINVLKLTKLPWSRRDLP